jgi:hypothetical protein
VGDNPIVINAASGHAGRVSYVGNTKTWTAGVMSTGEFNIADETAAVVRMQITTAGRLNAFGGATLGAVAPPQATLISPSGLDAMLTLQATGGRSWSLGSQSGGYWYLYDSTGTTFRMIVNTDGTCQNTTGTWAVLSDGRLKRDVSPYNRGLDAVLQLQPISFCYNGLGGTADDGTVQYGFIAEDVAEIMPELVGELTAAAMHQGDTEPTAFKTVDPTRSIYAVINSLKELAAQNAALAARVAALEPKDYIDGKPQ